MAGLKPLVPGLKKIWVDGALIAATLSLSGVKRRVALGA